MAAITTTITLPQEQCEKLNELLAEGRFASIDEAVAHSIDLLAYEALPPSEYEPTVRARIQEGIDASLRGELVPHAEIEAFFDDWESEVRI